MTREDALEVGRRPDGSMMTRTWVLHMLAKAFGLQIKIGGWPYGARYDRAINRMVPRGNIHQGGVFCTNATSTDASA